MMAGRGRAIVSTGRVQYTAVILAAGCGRRAGGFKPLWTVGDRVVIDIVIASAAAVCSRIRVVGGYAFEKLRAHLKQLGNDRVELVQNEDWARGMFSSVQVGLRGVDMPVFVHPSDVFGVRPSVYVALARAVDSLRGEPVVRPMNGNRTGHPILLMPPVVKAVRDADDGASLRDVLRGFVPKRDVWVDDDSIHRDFDTKAEFEEMAARMSAGKNGGSK